jgi:hypothetical protein
MRRILTMVVVLGVSMLALAGCRAEGEIGDTSTVLPRPAAPRYLRPHAFRRLDALAARRDV